MAAYCAIIKQDAKKLLMRPVCYYLHDRALNTLVTYGAIKAVVLFGALLVAIVMTARHQLAALPALPYSLANWDGGWYTSIAYRGYAVNYPNSAAFPPLYPFLIKVFSLNQSPAMPWVAIILSNAFSFVALYFLYQLVPLVVGKKYRLRACFAYMVFPVLIVCGLVAYSESLFLALTIGAFYYWKRSTFGLAALLAVGSVFARQVGAFILIIFAVDMLYAYWSRRDPRLAFRQLEVIGVTFAGVAALYLFYFAVFSDPLIVARVEATNWGNALSPINVLWVVPRREGCIPVHDHPFSRSPHHTKHARGGLYRALSSQTRCRLVRIFTRLVDPFLIDERSRVLRAICRRHISHIPVSWAFAVQQLEEEFAYRRGCHSDSDTESVYLAKRGLALLKARCQ